MFVLLNGPVFITIAFADFISMFAQKKDRKEGECKTFLCYVKGYISTYVSFNDEIFFPFLAMIYVRVERSAR